MSAPTYRPVGITQRTGKIITAGFSQPLLPLDRARRYLKIVNMSEESLWWRISEDATVGPPSEEILPHRAAERRGEECPPENLTIAGHRAGLAYMTMEG